MVVILRKYKEKYNKKCCTKNLKLLGWVKELHFVSGDKKKGRRSPNTAMFVLISPTVLET